MSRNSWSSTGSDAEVRHHFDQPFDYNPRNYLNASAHGTAQSESDEGSNGEDNYSDNGADAASLSESHDSFAAASEHPASEQTTQLPPQSDYLDDAQDQSNWAICRICLESASSDLLGGESLGRLLSPCKCKGTMKYVHATCLDQWRAASARSSSAVACDQCGAPYRFRKSNFVGIATSPTLLFVVSLFLFLLLIWTVGVIATFCMDYYDKPDSIKSRSASNKSKSSRWWPWRSSDDDMGENFLPSQNDAWSYLDVDYTTPGMWSYGTLLYEPAAYIKLIKEAVRSFASGEAVEAVREVVGLQDSEEVQHTTQDEPKEEQGFWSALKYEWMYGDGGLWQKSASSAPLTTAQTAQGTSASTGASSDNRDAKPAMKKTRERYDARAASDAIAINAIKRRRETAAKSARRSAVTQDEPQGLLGKLFLQFSVGFSLVGILSFVNLLVGASFLGPINLNFGLGRSFARMTSGGRGRNGQQEGVNIASILIVLLVIIGVVRALHIVYKLVRKVARRGLSRLEAVIVDWNGDDDDDAGAAAEDVLIASNGRFGDEAENVRLRRAFVQGQGD
ncbi:uncharacterized protein UTRI_00303 [Ustilago trichophora]|uniref:RING-CH-type domain-containing protein n=1 Tax=Ustilago trichophora TaxID=86804 RepID=A0A5C3DUI5_9BASI|nr:uncharacterized protein UTRI_00303 [Ustilago trichophora]